MALKASNQIKTQLGVADLALTAAPGESLLIKKVYVYSYGAEFVTMKTEKTTVGYFRVGITEGNHLAFPQIKTMASVLAPIQTKNLLDLLYDLGIFKGYPVAEGETFIITGTTEAVDVKAVIYDVMDADDNKADAPNGSRALEYLLINYGDTGATIAAAGDHLYDNPNNPREFPSFPFGDDVPGKHQITVHGILGSEVAVVNGTPVLAIYTRYLKMVKEREILFDEDRNGLVFDFSNPGLTAGSYRAGGSSVIGGFNHLDPRPPLLFTPPLLFEAGDELNVYVTVLEPVDASTIPTTLQTLALIETVKRIAG